jgi:hypothetical protein
VTYLLPAAERMPRHNKREHQYFDKILPDRWGCGVRLLNSARRQSLQEFARVLAEHEHADGGRGDARRLNKEWTNVNGAGL